MIFSTVKGYQPPHSGGASAAGLYSLKDLSKRIRQDGLVYRKNRAPVPMSAVHKIPRTRLYTGTFEWRGELFKGDGRVDEGFYLRMQAQWRGEQERCERDIERTVPPMTLILTRVSRS